MERLIKNPNITFLTGAAIHFMCNTSFHAIDLKIFFTRLVQRMKWRVLDNVYDCNYFPV